MGPLNSRSPVRLLIVDDSAVVRSVLTKLLNGQEGIEIVGTAMNARIARDKILKLDPDVLTLDVEMPEVSGLEFLVKLMEGHPLPVIMCSTLTQEGAEPALRALEIGAFDVIGKPALGPGTNLDAFQADLIEKIRAAGAARRRCARRYVAPRPSDASQARGYVAPAALPTPPRKAPSAPQPVVSLAGNARRHLIAIGASTGGTEALRDVLIRLPANSPGILIVQHMPATFTAAFAQRLDTLCAIEVAEARNGDEVCQGRALIAPGDQHMVVARRGGGLQVHITQAERVNYHRPSVEVLFDSITAVRDLPNDTVAVMLTGMGRDGSEAMLRLKRAGASTICQDQESSVVWGMAGEAVKLGAADRVASVHRIAPLLVEMVCREVSHSVS